MHPCSYMSLLIIFPVIHACTYYMAIQLALCDKKLLHIQVPDNVSRVPKNIEDGHWKG